LLQLREVLGNDLGSFSHLLSPLVPDCTQKWHFLPKGFNLKLELF
jgi:hypothetical protein